MTLAHHRRLVEDLGAVTRKGPVRDTTSWRPFVLAISWRVDYDSGALQFA